MITPRELSHETGLVYSVAQRAQLAWAVWLVSICAAGGCNNAPPAGTLVGFYAIQGVLIENICGQTALPASSPLKFDVQIREDQGVGYWMRAKQGPSTGSLNTRGEFRFETSQTQVVSSTQTAANQPPLQPSNFTSTQPDFDLPQRRTCALITRESIAGELARRNAADGGAVVEISSADASTAEGGDLEAEHTIEISPSSGSDCNDQLAAFGGNFLALPCHARYVLHGSLQAQSPTGSVGGAAAPH